MCPCLSSTNNLGINLEAKSQKPLQFVVARINISKFQQKKSLVVKWVLLRDKNILPRQYTSLETFSTSYPDKIVRHHVIPNTIRLLKHNVAILCDSVKGSLLKQRLTPLFQPFLTVDMCAESQQNGNKISMSYLY